MGGHYSNIGDKVSEGRDFIKRKQIYEGLGFRAERHAMKKVNYNVSRAHSSCRR